jgi:hypothetical protein
MGSQPADLSQTLDGLLTGLDSLLANRSTPAPRAAADQEAQPGFLSLMTALALSGLQPNGAAGVAESAEQMLRQHLLHRCMYWRIEGQPALAISPRWHLLLQALPSRAWLEHDEDPAFFRLLGVQDSLDEIRQTAGPVGQTIFAVEGSSEGEEFRLPLFPELGRAVTAQVGGHTAARWSDQGLPAVFFWRDRQAHAVLSDYAGLALVAPGRAMPVLNPPIGSEPTA